MNFKISKAYFYNALQTVTRSISSNSPVPALSGVKIDLIDGQLILTGSDADISTQIVLTNEQDKTALIIYEEGSIVIESKYLIDIVRKIDGDTVSFEVLDGTLTKISGIQAEYRINGMRSSDYPIIDFKKPMNTFLLDTTKLLTLINQTTFATSANETRPVLTGVNLKGSSHLLEAVATDSYRLAAKVIEVSEELDFHITIPAKSLNEVAKSLKENDLVEVCISESKAQFYFNNILIQTRLIEGNYPETKRLIPNEFPYVIEVKTYDILGAIDRCSLIKNEGVSIIKLTATNDEVLVSSQSQELGSCNEQLNVLNFTGDHLEISFSGKYVYEAIRSLHASQIKISFSGEMKPFIITTEEDQTITQLVLPVRTY